MTYPVRIYIVGTAGAGKSTLTQAFKLWMDGQGLNAITVNLDPGAEKLPYVPDVDIRDWVSVPKVMAEDGLGPNGAQIVCADIAALEFHGVSDVIDGFRADYVLIDTPGQIELFAFREASSVFLGATHQGNSIIFFVLDPTVARSPAGLVSLLLLSTSVQFRFSTPMDLVLGKSDLLTDRETEEIMDMCQYPDRMMDALGRRGDMDMSAVAAVEFFRAMETLGAHIMPRPVSSLDMYGIEDLYNSVQQYFHGGEDLRPD